jgi:hypothetical protein
MWAIPIDALRFPLMPLQLEILEIDTPDRGSAIDPGYVR